MSRVTFIFALLLVACEGSSGPFQAVQVDLPPGSLTSSSTLTVSVQGTARLQPSGSWVASVSGGVPPYYVYWYWRYCYKSSNGSTICGLPTKFHEGPQSTVSLTPSSSAQWIYVIAEVKDSKTAHTTGVGQKFVLGQAALSGGQCSEGSTCCSTSAPGEYKFNEYTSTNGTYTGQRYTRRACGGYVVYDPTNPNPPN